MRERAGLKETLVYRHMPLVVVYRSMSYVRYWPALSLGERWVHPRPVKRQGKDAFGQRICHSLNEHHFAVRRRVQIIRRQLVDTHEE